MRLAVGVVALVAALQCCCLGTFAEPESLLDVAAKKAVEESVGVPVGEAWKDIYDALVRKRGSKLFKYLRFWIAGVTGQSDPWTLAKHIMDNLKRDVFQGRVNKETWEWLTVELFNILSEWWKNTPENPRDAADVGTWQSLLRLHKDVMGPSLRGSNRVGAVNDLLLDPDLTTLRRWVNQWKGMPVTQPEKAAEGGTGSKTGGDS